MKIIKRLSKVQSASIIFAMVLSLFNTPTFAADMKPSESPYLIEGYDVVSYYRDSGPIPGNTNFLLEHGELTLLFSSLANLEDFKESPDQYMPAFNGNCAYGIAFGMVAMSDPEVYDIVDGRLYLQLNAGVRNRWNRRSDGHIEKANKIWDKLTVADASK